MFDELIKNLERLGKTGLTIPVSVDEDGYLDRQCPNNDCESQFKVFAEDWKKFAGQETTYCPFCRYSAPPRSWFPAEQTKEAMAQAKNHISAALNQGFESGARMFNQRHQSGFIKMSVKHSGGPTHHVLVPLSAQEAMKLKIQCEACSAQFAVVGSAFFCPCCGHNSVERTFDDSLRKVDAKLDNLEKVRSALEKDGQRDAAEVTCRSMVETGVSDCVVAFQRLMESLYKAVLGEGYEDWLKDSDLSELKISFHRRHLLQHTEGIVDERYLKQSGDASYLVGQRIVVREKDVRKLCALVRALATTVKEKVANSKKD
jgi:uncharacterized Zn finger protein (UPF0148 family)